MCMWPSGAFDPGCVDNNGTGLFHLQPVSGDEGVTELRSPGEIFRMLAKNLPGTKAVDLDHRFSSET